MRQWPGISKLCSSENLLVSPSPPDSFIPGEESDSVGFLEALSEAGSPRMKPGDSGRNPAWPSPWLCLEVTGRRASIGREAIVDSHTSGSPCLSLPILQTQPNPHPPGNLTLPESSCIPQSSNPPADSEHLSVMFVIIAPYCPQQSQKRNE